jgi:hypothetical protein
MIFNLITILSICIVAGILLIKYAKNKSSSQIMLLAIELTIVGGMLIIGLDNFADFGKQGNGSIKIGGLILIIIGFLISVLGFFMKNDKE